jgi:hypothetical protein
MRAKTTSINDDEFTKSDQRHYNRCKNDPMLPIRTHYKDHEDRQELNPQMIMDPNPERRATPSRAILAFLFIFL